MGDNHNLIKMLGVPATTTCPKCKNITDTFYYDYDVECGKPNDSINGRWELHVQCNICEHEFKEIYNIYAELDSVWEC